MSVILTNAWTSCYDFAHDMSGNPTSHLEVWVNGEQILRSKRRRQIGYNGYTSEAADGELRAHVKRVYGNAEIVLDPAEHPFIFGEDKPYVDRINRSGSNVRHYLIISCTPEVFWDTEQAIRMRLMGLVPEFIRAHRHTINNASRLIVAQADVTGLRSITPRDSSVTGLRAADEILKAALLGAISST